MPLRKLQIIIIAVVGVIVIVGSLMYLGVIPGFRKPGMQEVTLNFWGVGDSSFAFSEIFADYQKLHPNIRVRYRQFDASRYEEEMVNALARGESFDVLMFKNSWLPKHFDKIQPLPTEALAKVGLPFTFNDLQNLFPTVVIQDFAPEKTIYALPLYIDTLAMLYNGDDFDSKGIAVPPKNWFEFQAVLARLKKPVAIGYADHSIANASDILQLLMLQSGVQIVDTNFRAATFAQDGEKALSFYTQFANPKSAFYARYNPQQYSFDSFATGNTSAIFGYHDDIGKILERTPSLPIRIAAMPQPTASTRAINWARYYGVAVSRNSRNSLAAWQFILYLTTQPLVAEKYAKKTNRLPALRSLINQRLADAQWSTFALQALSARSYPRVNDAAIRDIFSRMIESVVSGQLSPYSAVVEGESAVTRLIQQQNL